MGTEIGRYTATSRGRPRIASNQQKLGRGKEEFSPGSFRGNVAVPTPPGLWCFVILGNSIELSIDLSIYVFTK